MLRSAQCSMKSSLQGHPASRRRPAVRHRLWRLISIQTLFSGHRLSRPIHSSPLPGSPVQNATPVAVSERLSRAAEPSRAIHPLVDLDAHALPYALWQHNLALVGVAAAVVTLMQTGTRDESTACPQMLATSHLLVRTEYSSAPERVSAGGHFWGQLSTPDLTDSRNIRWLVDEFDSLPFHHRIKHICDTRSWSPPGLSAA
jgi:hypothetical protein